MVGEVGGWGVVDGGGFAICCHRCVGEGLTENLKSYIKNLVNIPMVVTSQGRYQKSVREPLFLPYCEHI